MDEIKGVICELFEADWSSEEIAGRLEREGIIKLHHGTIDQYILADKLLGVSFKNTLGIKTRRIESGMEDVANNRICIGV